MIYIKLIWRYIKMYTLEKWHRKRRGATADFPLEIYYFKPMVLYDTLLPFYRHPELEIVLIHRGTTELHTTEKVWQLSQGDIAFICPNTLHRFRPVDMGLIELSLKFPQELITLPPQNFFQSSFVSPLWKGSLSLPLRIQNDHPAHRRIWDALSPLHPDREDTPGYREELLQAMFTVCTAIAPHCTLLEIPQVTPSGAIEACTRYLHRHYTEKLTLPQIAEQAGLHPNYLCARFKKVMGKTIYSYLTDIRLEHAKGLLVTSELSASEIAQKCGFHSVGFFIKKFKTRYNMTPKQYQKQLFRPND